MREKSSVKSTRVTFYLCKLLFWPGLISYLILHFLKPQLNDVWWSLQNWLEEAWDENLAFYQTRGTIIEKSLRCSLDSINYHYVAWFWQVRRLYENSPPRKFLPRIFHPENSTLENFTYEISTHKAVLGTPKLRTVKLVPKNTNACENDIQSFQV